MLSCLLLTLAILSQPFVDEKSFTDQFEKEVTELSLINSGSKNIAGLTAVAEKLKEKFGALGFDTSWNVEKRSFEAIKKPAKPKHIFLFVFHLDTVFEEKHPFQTVKRLENGLLSGPGVADDKGGIVMILEVLRAFQKIPDKNSQIEWRIFGAGDEELSSELSKQNLIELSKGSHLALVFEPGWYDEVSPKIPATVGGTAVLQWKVSGVEAHTGIAFESGRSAIKALAEHILFFESLTDFQKGIFFNVATVQGGTKLNVRPGSAEMKVGIRFKNSADEKFIEGSVEEAIKKFEKDSIKLQSSLTYKWHPQKIADDRLLKEFQRAARELGQKEPQPAESLAISASSILAAEGIPTLDSMGAMGRDIHSDREVLFLNSAYPKAMLICRFLENIVED